MPRRGRPGVLSGVLEPAVSALNTQSNRGSSITFVQRAWAGASLALAASLVLAQALAAQQTGVITGTVTRTGAGQPLADVQISVGGTGIGMLTTGDGQFRLVTVPVGTHTISATLIGYGREESEVEVTAGGAVTVDFELETTAVQLEGLVVTGTGIAAERRELGNSIELITAEQIAASGAVNIDEVLRGRVPGLSVQGTSGQAGAGSQILIRGLTSLNGRNRPLIYVDGIRVNDRGAYENDGAGNARTGGQGATVLNSINPQDIERIEVIKGAAAGTLYGTEASAGVIQIVTKRGINGQQRWTFSAEQGVSVPRHVGPDSDPTGLHLNDCTFGGPVRPEQTGPDPACPSSGSWLRNARHQKYNLNVRGGSEQFDYFFSANWGNQEGIANVPEQYDPQESTDLNVRGNFGFDAFDNLEVRLNSSFTRRDISWIKDGDNDTGFTENIIKLDVGETPENVDSLVFQSDIDQTIDHMTIGMNLNFTPSANFRQRLNLGWDWSQSTTIEFDPFRYWDFPDGSRTNDNEITRILTVDYAGSWFANLIGDWTSTFEWGGQYNDSEERGLRVDCIGFSVPGRRVLNDCEEATFENGGFGLQEDRRGFKNGGFFVQERFGWKNRLFLTAGVRADAFSQINRQLGLDFAFLTYPKAQLAYTISDHDFWPDWWDTFRFRAAWGASGDPPPQSARQTLWQIAGADEIAGSALIIQTIATEDIEAERTTEWEGGIDASLFNGRVSLQGTGFYRRTTDGILNNPLLPSGGIVESPPVNVGEWKTWGFEAQWDVAVLETSRSRLSLNGSFEWRDNEIVSLGELGQGFPQSVNTDFSQRFTEGQSFPQFYGEPVLDSDEFALPVRDTTQNLGTSIPNKDLALGLSFTYDRLTLDVFGSGQFGHLLLDEQAEEAATVGVWPQCVGVDANLLDHLNNGVPLEFTAGKIARCSSFSSVGGVDLNDQNEDWLFSGDYFRIHSASLSYRLPETWLPRGLTGARVQFRATNLALFTGFPTGADPDALNGASVFELSRSSGFTLPVPRTYAINVQVNF